MREATTEDRGASESSMLPTASVGSDQGAAQIEAVLSGLESAVLALLTEKVRSASRRAAVLGVVWERCFERVVANPEQFRPRSPGDEGALLRTLLEPIVAEALAGADRENGDTSSGARLRSGAVGVFVDTQLRTLEAEESSLGGASQVCDRNAGPHPLIADALTAARAAGDDVLSRNLAWMLQRDDGHSYAAIAETDDVKVETVRTGVRRARQRVRRIAYRKRRSSNAPSQGKCPEELVAAREAWRSGDQAALGRALLSHREAFGGHPYYLYLSGLHADDCGRRDEAVALFERILRENDDQSLRAKVLNCLGCIEDDRGDWTAAHAYWSRAVRVDPQHTPPHVNLLKNACDRQDKLAVHVCVDEIGRLLSSRSLTDKDKRYLVMRLAEHPDLGFARHFDAWRKGPARWIDRYQRAEAGFLEQGIKGAARAALTTCVAMTLITAAQPLSSSTPDRPDGIPATSILDSSETPSPSLVKGGDRGGHSGRGRGDSGSRRLIG